jgi:hypothetical protein
MMLKLITIADVHSIHSHSDTLEALVHFGFTSEFAIVNHQDVRSGLGGAWRKVKAAHQVSATTQSF